MADCIFSRSAYFGRVEWTLEERALLISPQASPIEVYPIHEMAGISGDGYTIQLRYGDDTLTLSRIGAGGPTLVEALRRAWLPLRAEALHLAGVSGGAKRFAAQVHVIPGPTPGPDSPPETPAAAAHETAQPFEALLFDDVLLLAREGHDVEPLFLTDLSAVTFDDATYTVQCRSWDGSATVISHLAGQTQEFMQELNNRRGALAQEAGHTLSARLPSLNPAARTALAARWLPGQMVSRDDMEGIAPGATQAVTGGWIAQLPHRSEAAILMSWAEPDGIYLCYTRPGSAARVATPARSETAVAAETTAPIRPDTATGPALWLLAGRDDRWLLENLSTGDHATYRFQGDSQTVGLVGNLLCAPQFSREALYLPLDQLAGEQADLAIAARDLGFLRSLRERFQGRVVHSTPQAWEAGLEG